MAIQIDKGVPAPKHRDRQSYPFGDMNVGDSFLVPLNGKPTIRVQSNVLSASRNYRPAKFSSKIVEGGVRVWRVA